MTFHKLFKMVETPRAIFEATPVDHEVFVGVGPKDASWYLRFRGEWDAGDQGLVGRFAVVLGADEAARFRGDVESAIGTPLVQEPSDGYYRRIKL